MQHSGISGLIRRRLNEEDYRQKILKKKNNYGVTITGGPTGCTSTGTVAAVPCG